MNAVIKQSEILFQIDEIGRWLKTLQNPGINPHAYEIMTVLLKMFTSSNSLYVAGGYADTSKTRHIDQPHVCLFGTSVEQSFFESLTSESLTDGFIGRLLVFEAVKKRSRSEARISTFVVPASILDAVKWWKVYQPAGIMGCVSPRPRVLTDSAGATAAFHEIDEFAESVPDGTIRAALWVRAHEKARKLALLYSVSENREATEISGDAAVWGCAVVRHLTRRMEWLANRHVADGPFGRLSQKVYGIIDNAGATGITGAALCRATRSLKPRERAEILDSLRQQGRVVSISLGGRIPIVYRSSRYK